MNTSLSPSYTRHRFPVEIISHAVWRSFRFSLCYRDVEALLAERGIMVMDETIRQWGQECGQHDANTLRRRPVQTGDTWHLDEVFLKMNRKQHDLWRAVDQHGMVLDMFVQRRRNTSAAKKFFRKLLKRCPYVPRVIITDKLASYGAAQADLLPHGEHRQHKRLNNRAENAHQPTRVREKIMRRCTSVGHAQRFLAAYGIIRQHFCLHRHRYPADQYRSLHQTQFIQWHTITGVEKAAYYTGSDVKNTFVVFLTS